MSDTRTAKVCKGCQVEKPLDDFYRDAQFKDGRRSQCKTCCRKWIDPNKSREATRRYREKDPEGHLHRQRRSWLKIKFGLTIEEYDLMLADQAGACAICLTDDPGKGRIFWPVDHNHLTGAVRGLLCSNCNMALGLFGDDIEVLRAAVEYLALHDGDGDD